MYTECPSCQTFFKITPNQLKAAGGKVRCGNCDEVFSALDGLVDVVPDEAIDKATNENASDDVNIQSDAAESLGLESEETVESQSELSEALSIQLDSEAEIENEALVESEAISSSEVMAETALLLDSDFENEMVDEEKTAVTPSESVDDKDGSASFADVEIPGTTDVVEDDIELALESAVVEGAQDTESKIESEDSKTVTKQEEINNDIDAALDGLFDGDTEIAGSESVAVSALDAENISELSAISELDDLDDMNFGAIDDDKEASSPVTKFEAQPSEAVSLGLDGLEGAGNLENDVSSLSEFERELEEVSAAGLDANSEPLAESSFDLGDSFIDSELSNKEPKSDKKQKDKDEIESPMGDSYILEEIEGKKREKPGDGSGMFSKLLWVLVILVLLLVLIGQFAYLKRQDLAMYPEVKPVIEGLCSKLNAIYPCDITPAKDVKAIELLGRNVVSHPNAKNALLITSTIENKASFDQAYPNLILTFSDINQKIIAKRKFSPTEYLAKGVDIEAGMKKSVPVKIMLEIVDPGEEAVNFEFNFQ